MKKFLVFLCSSILIFGLVGTASAYSYIDDDSNPESEMDLYEIFNVIFSDSGITYNSSDDLYNARGLPDLADYWWYETNGSINVTVRYAGYDQELGVYYDDEYTAIVKDIPPGENSIDVPPFNVAGNFMWVETLDGPGSGVGPWYSDSLWNTDEKDHFYAFDVTDLVPSVTGQAWLIAFEDLRNLGDADYNDLVALATDVAPIPEPSTILLFISGLIGLGGFRKKFRKI